MFLTHAGVNVSLLAKDLLNHLTSLPATSTKKKSKLKLTSEFETLLESAAHYIYETDKVILELFPENKGLARWIEMAQEKIAFQGLPSRICWLGLGEREKAGLAFNNLVKEGKVKAPIVIGRDHLDTGSVASPNRETEAMKDGSDAIADWPILNALINTAGGASWVSVHHGGGVGMGYSIHAGMVIVADGTEEAARRLKRVLHNDPAMGVIRHADAGYDIALDTAREKRVYLKDRLK